MERKRAELRGEREYLRERETPRVDERGEESTRTGAEEWGERDREQMRGEKRQVEKVRADEKGEENSGEGRGKSR